MVIGDIKASIFWKIRSCKAQQKLKMTKEMVFWLVYKRPIHNALDVVLGKFQTDSPQSTHYSLHCNNLLFSNLFKIR